MSSQALAAQRQAAVRESEQALAAQQQAAADADARHQAALQQTRQEAEQALAAQQRAHADADAQRDTREQQASGPRGVRGATMAAELSRVRRSRAAAAEGARRRRADIDQSREAERRARMDADLARTAAKEARSAADAAIARAHDVEVTRGHVEERLRNEADGLKQERDRLRLAHQVELEQLRVETDRDVRAQVSAAAQAEIAQLRADDEARLTSELSAASPIPNGAASRHSPRSARSSMASTCLPPTPRRSPASCRLTCRAKWRWSHPTRPGDSRACRPR